MSQVEFIQLGTAAEPKKNYEIEGINEYSTVLSHIIQDHPGAVIFTTFIKSASGKLENEIYANGQLYSVSGGGSGAVYYGTEKVDANGQIENFSSNHEGAVPEKGNVYIYDPDDAEKTNGGNIADCTAYYYDGTKWVAFTGNVNAENVWFNQDFILAGNYTQVGNITKDLNGTGTFSSNKKNLKQVLESVFTKELYPQNITGPTYTFSTSVTAPSIVIKKASATSNLSSRTSLEVGTQLSLSKLVQNSSSSSEQITVSGLTYGYKLGDQVNDGTEYKRTATPTSSGIYELTLSTSGLVTSTGETPSFISSTNSQNLLEISGSSDLYISDGTNTLTVKEIGLTYTPEGFTETTIYPVSNLGNTYKLQASDQNAYSISVSQAQGNSKTPENTKTFTLTGYYPIFWGTSSVVIEIFSSDLLKNLTHLTAKPEKISTPANTIQIIVAIPYTDTGAPATSFKSIVAGNGSGFTDSNKMKTATDILVNFNGNISHKYKVLYAYAAQATSNANSYTITYNN